MRYATSPGATGTTVNSETGAPVAGAEVFISRALFSRPAITNAITGEVQSVDATTDHLLPPSLTEAVANCRTPIVVTGADGRFSIPAERKWGVYIVPMDVFPPYGTLVVRCAGFADTIRFVYAPPTVVEVGEIRLKSTPE